jgi:hypothetical protein
MLADWLAKIASDGFAIVPAVFNAGEVERLTVDLGCALAEDEDGSSMRSRAGTVVAARNVLELFPAAASVWRRSPLVELLSAVLGKDAGLVRVLFFDKPPDRTWSLAWHKDLTIAVRDNKLPSHTLTRPTTKAGVPHVEAARELLEQMLTLRIHLDDVTDENGPLRVVPGSHRTGKETVASDREPAVIRARAGTVLAMRPLVSHSSGASLPGCVRHRRILHLEFAGQPTLPDGYQWRDFLRP